MENLFGLIILVSLVLLVIGLFSPRVSLFWYKNEVTRAKSVLYYGIAILVSFVLFGISNDKKNDVSYAKTDNSFSSSSANSTTEKDPYEIMHVAFKGSPEIDEIKPLLEAVMDTFSLPKTDDNRLKLANGLVVLRKASTVGVTEMEILKQVYRYGTNKISLAQQLGLSATILETSKKD